MNKKRIRSILLMVLALLICFSIFVSAAGVASSARKENDITLSKEKQALEDLKTRLETSENNKAALLEIIENHSNELHDFDKRKQEIEIKISYTTEEIQLINELSEQYKTVILQAEKSIMEQEVKLELAQSDFASIVKYLYENGKMNVWELLLSSDNLSDFFAKYDYIDSLLEYNNLLREEIESTSENLKSTKEDYDNALLSLEKYKNDLEVKQKELEEESKKLDSLFLEYADGVQRTREQLEAAEKAEDELLKQIAEVQAKISEQEAAERSESERLASISAEASRREAATATTKNRVTATTQTEKTPETTKKTDSKISDFYTTTFSWPLSVKGRITSRYGYRTDSPFTSSEHHNGLDVAASKDTPILAVAAGVVTRSEYSGNFGNVIVIDHGNGLSTLYCHCNSRLVSVGAKVLQDQVIAKVGQTGFHDMYTMTEIKNSPLSRIEIKGAGAACAFIKTSVFKKLEYPWFQYVSYKGRSFLSEDFYFCNSAIKAGYIMWADTRVKCGHLVRGFQYE